MSDLIYSLRINLNRLSKLPLYQQVIDIIKHRISLGELKKGDFLPSEREFTQYLDISRITIRKALEQLEKEHVITRTRGYGTYINDTFEYSLKTVEGFSQQIQLRGQKPNTIWINKQLIQPSLKIAAQLQLTKHEQVFELKRIRYIDESPVSIEHSFVPAKLIDNVYDIQLSLYRFFHSRNIIPQHIKNWVSAMLPDDEFKRIIPVNERIPVLVIKQLVSDGQNVPIEYSINHCRGDLYVFTSEE